MRQAPSTAAAAAWLALCPALAPASDLTLDGQVDRVAPIGSTVDLALIGAPGLPAFVAYDLDPGPVAIGGEQVPLGFSPQFGIVVEGTTDAAGLLAGSVVVPNNPNLIGLELFLAGVVLDPTDPNGLDLSGGSVLGFAEADLEGLVEVELFGVPRPGAPFFDWVRVAQAFEPIAIAVDPAEQPQLAGATADVYLVADRTRAEWNADPTLVDLTLDGPDALDFTPTDVPQNTFVIDPGSVAGSAGASLGRGFDVVVDVDRDGQLGPGDLVDGYSQGAGMYVCQDPTTPGPYDVVEVLYTGGTFLGQNLFYPANVEELDDLHLVVVSHGNGHNYQWYDHIGNHLASWGYVVMSHENNTQPGIFTASTTTLNNTEFLLANL